MSSVTGRLVNREKAPDMRFERQIITGMIVSDEFLQGVVPIYQQDCLRIPFAKTIARWCLEYFNQYQIAPGKHIEDIFKDQKNNIPDPDEAEMLETFLSDISKEYVDGEAFNAGYILDKTEKHFRELSLKNLTKEIQKTLIGDRIEEAEALVKGYTRIARIQTKGVDPITDSKIIAAALDDNSGDKLFSLPGILGDTIGMLERGWLFSFVGASGTGKTWWLMLTALRALFAGLNVVFISMEMSEKQMTRRIQHWINGQPTKKWAGELSIPTFKNLSDTEIYYKKVTKKELTIPKAINKSKAVKRSALIRGNAFKLVTYPSRSITMNDINAYLHNLEYYENFIPDVIVTDYADKVKPDDARQQYRHQIAGIWEAHKALAQEKNCIVVTASQSNTARTGNDIKQGDWSESIEKLNMSDAGMSINMTADDKRAGIMRAKIMKQRHDDFDLVQEVMVLHQLRIGRPYLDSRLMERKKEK
jgi:replicative DNA helicase